MPTGGFTAMGGSEAAGKIITASPIDLHSAPPTEGLSAHSRGRYAAGSPLRTACSQPVEPDRQKEHLGCDSCMIGAGQPQGWAASHAVVARHDVLQGHKHGVAHVQAPGHVGRRHRCMSHVIRLRSIILPVAGQGGGNA